MKLVSSDSECMARLAAGDANALRELYQRHGRALLRFSAPMCRSRQAAEDMVHDTFVALHARARHLSIRRREPCSATCAACCVIASAVTSGSRSAGSRSTWTATRRPCTSSDAHSPADEIARSEITAAFRRAMLELPLQHREIIALCDLEELPYTTVAGILDCPVGTVRSRLHRARALLTIRLASLELIDLESEPPFAHRGLS